MARIGSPIRAARGARQQAVERSEKRSDGHGHAYSRARQRTASTAKKTTLLSHLQSSSVFVGRPRLVLLTFCVRHWRGDMPKV